MLCFKGIESGQMRTERTLEIMDIRFATDVHLKSGFWNGFRGYLLIISVLVKCRDFYISGVRSVRTCPFACKILSVHSSVNLFFPCK